MAKYRHRTFEMFEFHDEAAAALAVKPREAIRVTKDLVLDDFEHLTVETSESIVHVRLHSIDCGSDDQSGGLRADLMRLAECLQNDSRVVIDFRDIEVFSSALVEALETFYQRLKFKGSRLVLCNLDANVKASFYPQRLPR